MAFNFSPEDMDYLVRTVYGEASNQKPIGQQAVAAVIANRAAQSGKSLKDVVLAKNQFEPWGSRADQLRALNPNDPQYQGILQNLMPFVNGEVPDPTNGATHFYAPKAQAALGRNAPSWDNGTGVDIGDHRFFNLGYGGGGPHGITRVASNAPLSPSRPPMEQAFTGGEGSDVLSGGSGGDTVATTPAPQMSTLDKFLTGGPGAIFGMPQKDWDAGDALIGAGAALMARDNPSGAQALASALRYKKDGKTGANRQVVKQDAKSGQVTVYDPETNTFKTQQVFDREPEMPQKGTQELFQKNSDAASTAYEVAQKLNRHRERIANGDVDMSILGQADKTFSTLLNQPLTPAQRNAVELAMDLEDMRNQRLLEAKGVQTEGDAQRAMNAILPGMTKYNNSAILTSLDRGYSDLMKSVDRHTQNNDALYRRYGDRIGPETYGDIITQRKQQLQNAEANFAPKRDAFYKKATDDSAAAGDVVTGRRQTTNGGSLEGKTAVNPQTGERMIMRNGKWEKM